MPECRGGSSFPAVTLKPSINWLLAFVPVTVILERIDGIAPPVVFFSAALSIVPIASLIVHSTEQLSTRTGEAVGGLLNATFGNAPELIIAIVALRAGMLDLVRASIIGAILANLLLALGLSFLLGGLRHKDQEYNAGAARLYSSMMLLAVICLIVPSAFEQYFAAQEYIPQVRSLNTRVALMLLATYGLYLLFQLRTHPHLFRSAGSGGAHHPEGAAWSLPRALGTLIGASVLAAWMSEILVGAAEGTGQALGMSESFIGLVVVAVVGGAAESLSAIASARKNRLDLTMGIVFGSCIQIALFIAPVLVLISAFVAPETLQLSFPRAQLGFLLFGVLIGTVIAGDGRGNWYKGVQLVAVYAIMAVMLALVPEVP